MKLIKGKRLIKKNEVDIFTQMKKISKATFYYDAGLSQKDIICFQKWTRYFIVTNNHPKNKQILLSYFFETFGPQPDLFYRFLHYFKKEIKNSPDAKKLAEKYLDILSTLCERFNFFEEKNILNDLCFKIVHPEKYAEIKKIFSKYESTSKKIIKKGIEKLSRALTKKYDYSIHGRYKNMYSIYKKINLHKSEPLKINDIFGFRIILNTESVEQCFEIANILHDKFYPIPDFFKDYISIPKINGYQSLHTGLKEVVEELDTPIEVQIRTLQMHHFAEKGLAAHWLYNEEKKSTLITEKEQQLVHCLSCALHHYEKRCYLLCFTDKGDIKKMPKGTTTLDFAYTVHSNIGNKAIAAEVNEIKRPLHYRLKEGDQIKIITDTEDQVKKDWLRFAKSKETYKKISDYLKLYAKN